MSCFNKLPPMPSNKLPLILARVFLGSWQHGFLEGAHFLCSHAILWALFEYFLSDSFQKPFISTLLFSSQIDKYCVEMGSSDKF